MHSFSSFETKSSFHLKLPSLSKEAKGSTHRVRLLTSGGSSPLLAARRSVSPTLCRRARIFVLRRVQAGAHTFSTENFSPSSSTLTSTAMSCFQRSRWRSTQTSFSLPWGNRANRLKRSQLLSGIFFSLVRLWNSRKMFEAFEQRPKCCKSSRAQPQQRHGSAAKRAGRWPLSVRG